MDNLYDILGVDKSASPDEIKTAYRKKAQETHPDKGGDADEFKKVQNAYDILSNSDKRATYDKTGRVKTKEEMEEDAYKNLVGCWLKALNEFDTKEEIDIETFDIVKGIRTHIDNTMKDIKTKVKDMNKNIKKREKFLKRFKYKGSKNNMVHKAVKSQIDDLEASIREAEEVMEIGKIMRRLLPDFEYNFSANSPPPDFEGPGQLTRIYMIR
jgi:curved DNA-binding protein CbpA